jgi:hypothetical protein
MLRWKLLLTIVITGNKSCKILYLGIWKQQKLGMS